MNNSNNIQAKSDKFRTKHNKMSSLCNVSAEDNFTSRSISFGVPDRYSNGSTWRTKQDRSQTTKNSYDNRNNFPRSEIKNLSWRNTNQKSVDESTFRLEPNNYNRQDIDNVVYDKQFGSKPK